MLNREMVIANRGVLDQPIAFRAVIGGKFIDAQSRETIARESPAHGGPISLYPRATIEDVNSAVAAARNAADTRIWSGMSGRERHRILLKVAQIIEARRQELGLIEALEGGKPIGNVDGEIQSSIDNWEYGATLARHTYGDTYDELDGPRLGLTLREPIGVIGIITPWNYPLGAVSQKLPFALAAGNCAVIKPSELTSGTTLILGEILLEAGVPEGVVNIVCGYGQDVGQAIVEHLEVDMISFTGSTAVGRKVGAIAGETLRRVSLELGGKSAQVVFADANLEAAARGVATGITLATGQICIAGSRLLVERSVAVEFTNLVFEHMKAVRVGDPFDAYTQVGPVISSAQRERIQKYLKIGSEEGATGRSAALSERLRTSKGYYVAPMLFSNVQPGMRIEQEEIFGPVLVAMPFDTADEALHIANGTSYGLYGGVWSKNIDRAFAFARYMKCGTVEVNGYLNGSPELSVGGIKASGIGHEKGRHSIEEYTQLKTVQLSLDPVFSGH